MIPVGDSCNILSRFPNFMMPVINFSFPLTIEVIGLSQFSTITTLIVVCNAIVLCCLEDVTEHYVSFHSLSNRRRIGVIGDKELSILVTGLKECQNLKKLQ